VAQWLEHGELPDEGREQLGFDMPKDEDAAAAPERMVEHVAHRLARLVADTRPVVLCFDQIESLQVSPDDRTGLFAFGRLAADLFDQLEPLLLVTCAQSALLPQIRQAIARADYHRVAQQERVLEPLTERVRRRVVRWFCMQRLLAAAAAADMLAWENSGFSVDASVRITL